MRRSTLSLVLVAAILVTAPAQSVSGTVSPNPATPGQTLQFTLTAFQSIQLPSSCAYTNIRAVSPAGPPMPLGFFCLTVITPLNAGQSKNQTISTAGYGPGTYWVEVQYFGTGPGPASEFFCFELRNTLSDGPILSSQTPAQQGTLLSLTLNDPPSAGQFYIAAASLTSNTGIPITGFASPLCLDPDPVFDLSFPAAFPGLFSNFSGVLDGSGQATGIAVSIPAAPVLNHRGLHIQAAILGTSWTRISNGQSFTILP